MNGQEARVAQSFWPPTARQAHVDQRRASGVFVTGAQDAEVFLQRPREGIELVARIAVMSGAREHFRGFLCERLSHPGERSRSRKLGRGVFGAEHPSRGWGLALRD
jgi:hypothetical protein